MTDRIALLAGLLCLITTPVLGQLPRCSDTTDYAWLERGDTTSVERMYVGSGSFISRMDARSQRAHLVYAGKLGPDGLVTEMTVNVWRPGADTADVPTQVASVQFGPTIVRALIASPAGRVQLQQDSVTPGSMPYMSGVVVFLELARRRAEYLGPAAGAIPMLWLFTGGHREEAHVHGWGLDSARITMPQETFRFVGLGRAGPFLVTAASGGSARAKCSH